ncbi:MAG: Unknown protein [uncultured Sulfurovum sp.]|uniref:Uncharacterized protein n=1 Tax=uncultured Sulfurovum sp. TaxID=269237 RepID=A0A6S6T7I0_9BACT|nr:MAG: Unknown protein [uncultured Sulfurovum sp.]
MSLKSRFCDTIHAQYWIKGKGVSKEYLNTMAFYFFYILVIIGIASVFFSYPFVRLPYDAIAHLMAIDERYHDVAVSSTSIPPKRLIWHGLWATIFQIFHIESVEFLLRTKIIHITQTLIALFSVYYFSHVVIRNVFKDIDSVMVKYLSLWSVIIWVTIFATFSIYYHQVWVMWYSINYQITLPLFFYITGLTLVLTLEKPSRRIQLFFIVQVFVLIWFILQAHAMELLYYFLYVFVLALMYVKSTYRLIRTRPCLVTWAGIFGIFFIYMFKHDNSKFSMYLMRAFDRNDPSYLYHKIVQAGEVVVSHYSRSAAVINEMMYMIFYVSLLAFIFMLWNVYRKKDIIKYKVLIFVVITSLFVVIPLYVFPAGLFGLITREHVVHRFYYSASLFVLLPILVYYILHSFTVKLRYVNALMAILLISVFYYSKSSNRVSHNYYKNIMSIKSSFDNKNIRFNLSQKHIEYIGTAIESYEKQNKTGKETLYFARYDIAFVLKYVYGKKIWWKDRRTNYNHNKEYWDHYQYQSKRYHPVLYRTHGIFPKYVPFR